MGMAPLRNNSNNMIKNCYRPADRKRSWLGKGSFDLRFPRIIGSLVDSNVPTTLYHLASWRMVYKHQGIPKQLPIVRPKFQTKQFEISFTWLGHSTAVISLGNDANILIDPVFADRCSPLQFIGPKRFRPPACKIQQLPKIDLVLVSHDHYDHLDASALQKLFKRFPQARFIAGLESSDVFPSRCRMIEMDWTEQKTFEINGKKLKITFVPVCHWSSRHLFDKNKRLWGGFVIETQAGQKIFYSGDTGYCEVFKILGERFQGFDLAILPIGAYTPREYLSNQHISPEEAVIIHKEILSKKSVGVHWGTFPLGYEHYTSARSDLKHSALKHNLKQDQFITLHHGDSLALPYLLP